MLSKEQQKACELVVSGHSAFITGQAGVGKSFLISHIVRKLRERGKNVALTCTTGIASTNFEPELKAKTLHKWCGMEDGRHSNERIVHLIQSDERFVTTRDNIIQTDVLLIDEVSMLSARLFEQVESICSIKNANYLFGGIQVITCGDFFQLPPVANVLYGDDGSFAFTSPLWERIFGHIIKLDTVIRQSDQQLISAINESAKGYISLDTLKFIKSLSRPLEENYSIKLFATNALVDQYNRDCILSQHGELYEFISEDTGDAAYLSKIVAPKTLWLKKGTPVVLLRNLSDQLVNGSNGVVIDIGNDGPVVKFEATNLITVIKRRSFTIYDPKKNANIAERIQYPMKPAYALTIHKAQGMTLERVAVDCRGIFKPGQFGVAIGRATSVDGLQVINFSSKACIPQPDELLQFSQKESLTINEDFSCCKAIRLSNTGIEDDMDMFDAISTTSLDEAAEISYYSSDEEDDLTIEDIGEFRLPPTIDPRNIVQALHIDDVITDLQGEINSHIASFSSPENYLRFEHFCTLQWKSLSEIYQLSVPMENIETKHWTTFYSKYQEFATSPLYVERCKKLFLVRNLTSSHNHTCYKICVELRSRFLKLKSDEKVQESIPEYEHPQRQLLNSLVDGARGKIRYVGGFCVAKLRKNVLRSLNALLYRSDVEGQQKLKVARVSLELVECLTASELTLLEHSSDKGSLKETSTRQNIRHGLTNISDESFIFFTALCNKILVAQSFQNLCTYGQTLEHFIVSTILDDLELSSQWSKLFQINVQHLGIGTKPKDVNSEVKGLLDDLTFKVEVIQTLFEDVVRRYCNVLLNQFRKDYLTSVQEKKMAHRHQVLATKAAKRTSKCFTYEDLLKDKSDGKLVSHHLFKGNVLKNPKFFEECKFTKKEVITVCKCYGVPCFSSNTKKNLLEKLIPVLMQCENMPFPHHIGDVSAPTEQLEQETQVTGAAALETVQDADVVITETDSDEKCKECSSDYGESDSWISCDWCQSWFHRLCAGLQDNKKWKWYFNTKRKFKCPHCKK